MKRLSYCGTLAVLLAGAAYAGGEREEQLRLEGNWEIVELGYVGAVKPYPKGLKIIPINTGKMAYTAATIYALRLAPTREPREVDLTVVSGSAKTKGKVYKGIYKLEGDTFTIHYALTGDRPKNFTDGAGTKVRVMKLQRVRQAK